MNRTWFVCMSPVAALAGMVLVHCSSSSPSGSSSTTTSSGGSSTHASSTTTTSGTTTHSGTTTGTATSSATTTGGSSGTTTHSGTTTSAASTSTGPLTDTHDAGPCVGPDGGAACDPGNVECNNAQCAVPNHECCNGSGTSQSCLAVTATCGGNKQACDEKSDCPDGQLCCLMVTTISGDFSISCQTGTTCPTGGFASAQICKTNAECSTGACSIYNCQGQNTEACQAPSAIDCTKE